jgi:hypothetical protein
MRQPTGYILYRGPSMLDGSPIVVVATGTGRRSKNAKTGDMVQTYILADGVDPVTASRTGQDAAVCGDCKHRPANMGTCYVTLIHGPSAVYRALQRNSYPRVSRLTLDDVGGVPSIAQLGKGRMVRLGTYGDPAAVPVEIWEALVSRAEGRTGYTHQWQNPAIPADAWRRLVSLVMASVDTDTEAVQARDAGLRYFRVRPDDAAPLGPREFVCPASEEAGKRKTCATCAACDGSRDVDGRASPVIVVHGSKARKFIPIRAA